MSKRRSPGSGSAVVEGLDVHLAQFLATLAAGGVRGEDSARQAAGDRTVHSVGARCATRDR